MAAQRHEHALGWHMDDLSDFALRFVIRGRPLSFKRAKQIVTFGGHASLALTKEAKAYMRDAAAQLRAQWLSAGFNKPIPGGVFMNAAVRSYLPTRGRTDASNLYEAPQDALKRCTATCKPKCDRHAGVIADDYWVRTHDGSDRLHDPANPRVEILLTPYRGAGEAQASLPLGVAS